MNFTERLRHVIKEQNSLLCIGLDPDMSRLPKIFSSKKDPLYSFCQEIIEATEHFAAAYKLNFAFFEAEGLDGWRSLEKLAAEMPDNVISIADAKRADIGNSSQKYAEAILQNLDFDCVTVNPYMGRDSVAPFLQWSEKGVFALCVTSNPGSKDFQRLPLENGEPLYEKIIDNFHEWNENKNLGLVVGATHTEELASVRKFAQELPFLIPGVGAQGGSLQGAVQNSVDAVGGFSLINASRSIIYKSSGSDFAQAAGEEARALHQQMIQIRGKL